MVSEWKSHAAEIEQASPARRPEAAQNHVRNHDSIGVFWMMQAEERRIVRI
jgi:hypothetical protein